MQGKPKTPQPQQSERIIRLRDVMQKTGLSKSSIYRLAADTNSDFPAAVKLTMATVGWYESLIDAWIVSRQAA
ncbi:AlpA family phage regulatory protein [Thiothrix lacustris]|uniref:AlpA family phage regulatory protein n=1 Tax=Thiothrix lacustris TaxID=525917 RepID=UPI00048C9823|nr:AlpA family transcriptional regulator [Thiothrix lacustris]